MSSEQQDACYAVLDDDGTVIGIGIDDVEAMYDAADFLLKTGREIGFHPDGRERVTTGLRCTDRYAHAIASRPAGIERLPAGRQLNRWGLLDLRPEFVRAHERTVRLVIRPKDTSRSGS